MLPDLTRSPCVWLTCTSKPVLGKLSSYLVWKYKPELLPGFVRQSTLYSKFLNSISVNKCERWGGVTISPFSTFHSTPSLAFQPVRSLPLKRLIQPSLSSADEMPLTSPQTNIARISTVSRDRIIGSRSRSGLNSSVIQRRSVNRRLQRIPGVAGRQGDTERGRQGDCPARFPPALLPVSLSPPLLVWNL